MLPSMPSELHHIIISYLPITEVMHYISTCRQLHGIISNDIFWKHRLLMDYKGYAFVPDLQENYKVCYQLTILLNNLSFIKTMPYNLPEANIPNISKLFFKTKFNISRQGGIYPTLNLTPLINLNTIHMWNMEFPVSICDLPNLTSLNLSINSLTSLPSELGNLVNLRTLCITNNFLTQLPPEIGNLLNLNCLNVSRNNLTSLPPELYNLINLTDLLLSYNKLSILSADVKKLVNLKDLHLEENPIAELPHTLFKMNNLRVLKIDMGTKLPSELNKSSDLLITRHRMRYNSFI